MAYIEINGSFHEDAPIEQKAHLVKALDAIANKISTQDLSCWQTDRSFYRFLEVPESVADSPDKTFCFPEHLAGVVKDILFKKYKHYSPEQHTSILEQHFRATSAAFLEVKSIWKAYWIFATATVFIFFPLGKYWGLAGVALAIFGAWKAHRKAEETVTPVRQFTRSRFEELPDFQRSKMISEATQISRRFGIPEEQAFF